MDAVLRDVRLALRSLARVPGFAALTILTLGLGIGATTAIFTVVDAVLLTPLPLGNPDRLVMLQNSAGARFSSAYLHEWGLRNRTLDDIAGWRDARANLTGRGDAIEVLVDRATTNFFAVLGVPAILGRTFSTEPDLSRVEPEVVLSYGLWQRHYGGEHNIVGQPIALDGMVYTIVGVMPAGFTVRTNELSESRAELWMPLPLVPNNWTGMGGALTVVARLRANSNSDQAREDLSLIARRIEEQYPSYSRDWRAEVLPLLDATVRDVRPTLLVLFGAVGLLLIIACVNVANLILSRVAARHSELAIRHSLGATNGRLVRQLFTESFVLAAAGGTLGILLAAWGTKVFISALPAGLDLPRSTEIGVDLRVLAFAFLVTMLTAVLFGVLPGIGVVRAASYSGLRQTADSSRDPRRNRIGNLLIVSQMALALVLLAAAGLLGRSFWELTRVDPGFQAEQVLTLRTTLAAATYDTDDRVRAFGNALLDRMANAPGISAVGFANYLPLTNFGAANRFEIEGRPEARIEDQKFSGVWVVGGRYFEAMGIPLLRGRLPGSADSDNTEAVFIIDDRLSRLYWPNGDAIGARLVWQREGTTLAGQVIGIVGSVRWKTRAEASDGFAYWWFPNAPDRDLAVVARVTGNPTAAATLLAAKVKDIDPNQPVGQIRAMEEFVADDLARPRFTMLLLSSFALAALLLAAVGLYGVIAFTVTQRTREIGVRVALGAQHREVVRFVMQRGLVLIGTGLTLGIAATLALGRLISGLLFGVTPTDPATLLAVVAFLVVIALVATYVPARRAALIEPLLALRAE